MWMMERKGPAMASYHFDELLAKADLAAQVGDWRECLSVLQRASQLNPAHAGAVTGMGACLIQLGRPQEALPCFQRAAELAPDSADTRNNLGVAFALIGDYEAAAQAYRDALALDPDNQQARKNLGFVCLQMQQYEEGIPALVEVLQSNPQDGEAMYLLGQCYEVNRDFESARFLYERVLSLNPDAPGVGESLAGLPRATPQPERIARPEHAQKLAALKGLKAGLNGGSNGSKSAAPAAQPLRPAQNGSLQKRMVVYGTGIWADDARLLQPIQRLAMLGWAVKPSLNPEPADPELANTLVFSRPQAARNRMEALRQAARAGKQIIVDVDEDFLNLPGDHPDFARLGGPAARQDFEAAVRAADWVTVSSPVLAQRYASLAKKVVLSVTGWDRDNPLWDKPAPRRRTINIGWVGMGAGSHDLAILKSDLVRLVKEDPNVLVAVMGDPTGFDALAGVPEDQRIFLPQTPYQDYPYVLAELDILILPLRDTPYNQAFPAVRLMEAGARRIPWVASPIPSVCEWAEGGLTAARTGEWYSALKKLVGDPGLRNELGQAGRCKAEAVQPGPPFGVELGG
jgi:Flp pilus assembly protein TadD/glycosyltransferase involved in cell wall biosynthesis